MRKISSSHLTTLGIVGVIVSVAALVANPFQPRNFRSTPEDLRSPWVSSVWVGIYDADGNSVSYSALGRKAEMGVSLDNLVGANDCAYWTGDHSVTVTQLGTRQLATTRTAVPVSSGTTGARLR